MSHLTDAEFEAVLTACNWKDGASISNIVSATHTNTKFNEVILEKQMEQDGAARAFEGFWGTRLWEDGQGMDEVREYATPPYIPVSYQYFIEKMKPCNGANRDDCDRDACIVPEGGRGTLPPFQLFEWAMETQRQCIANIRHIRDFRYWANKVITNRTRYDEQVMNMFFTLMGWKTAGHKVVLEYDKATDANGNDSYTPAVSSDARNPFRGFKYNYMQEFFPAVAVPENIGPMSLDVLEQLARTWTQNGNDYYVAKGSRGQKIWEFWYSEDWYREEGIQDPDHMEKIKEMTPANLFAGYSLDTPREVIGNFAMKTMPFLPRMTESSDGGLIPVDTHEGIDIEFGQEFVLNRAWQNAPFGLALIPSPKQGSIIVRSDLNTSPEGFPILPITSSSNWRIRNDFDKDCNKYLNKPYSEKMYEMGMQMDDPDAAIAIIHRFRTFRTNPENFCDLAPVTAAAPNAVCADYLSIGCGTEGKRVHQASMTEVDTSQYVTCTSAACSNNGSEYLYEITINRVAGNVDFNSLNCACGSAAQVLVYDTNGDLVRAEPAIVRDLANVFPDAKVYIELATELADGECIKGIICEDASPTVAEVVACNDDAATKVTYTVDSVLVGSDGEAAVVTDQVTIKLYDADDVLLDTIAGAGTTLTEVDHSTLRYQVTSDEAGFQCDGTTAHPAPAVQRITLTMA